MKFPTIIRVRGIPIEVESWDELDIVINRYGTNVDGLPEVVQGEGGKPSNQRPRAAKNLETNDEVLLRQFVEKDGWGVFNEIIGGALGAGGKSIWPALRRWAVEIQLAENESADVFERFNRTQGRGYCLKPHFLRVARSLLGE